MFTTIRIIPQFSIALYYSMAWYDYWHMTYNIILDILIILTAAIIAGEIFEQLNLPGYFLCVDDYTKSVLVIFRGTKSFSDILTDLHCSSIKYRQGYCHKGILTAAPIILIYIPYDVLMSFLQFP